MDNEIADDDLASSDPDSHRKVAAWKKLKPCYLLDNVQRGQRRALRIIIVSKWVAEIGKQAIAHEFGQEAIVSRHNVGTEVVNHPNHFPVVLDIELSRQRR
jgi:hypothetical protein